MKTVKLFILLSVCATLFIANPCKGAVLYDFNFSPDEIKRLAHGLDAAEIGKHSNYNYIELLSGSVLFSTDHTVVIQTPRAKITVAPGAIVYILTTRATTMVHNLNANRTKKIWVNGDILQPGYFAIRGVKLTFPGDSVQLFSGDVTKKLTLWRIHICWDLGNIAASSTLADQDLWRKVASNLSIIFHRPIDETAIRQAPRQLDGG